MSYSNKHTSLVAVAVSLLISACGGGGGNVQTISGAVIDGYIKGAQVCLDVNANMACDTGEPNATTDADGSYSLEYAGSTAGMHILAVVPAGAEDSDLGVIEKPFDLLTPASAPEVVSPLTTLVSSEMITTKAPLEEARKSVKAEIGRDPIAYDFKAANDTDTLAIAQVAAVSMANAKEALKEADTNLELSATDVVKAAVEQVKTVVLPTVLSADKKVTVDVGAAASQAQMLAKIQEKVDVKTVVKGRIQQVLAKAKAGDSSALDLETLIKGDGFVVVRNDDTRLEDGTEVTDTMVAEHVVGTNLDAKTYLLYGDGKGGVAWYKEYQWNDMEYYFDGKQWSSAAEDEQYFDFTEGNCLNLLPKQGSLVAQKVCSVSKDLSGKKIIDFVKGLCSDESLNPSCSKEAVFPDGSWGADLTFSQTHDFYRLWVNNDGWDGYAVDLDTFGSGMLNNNAYHYTGSECNTKFQMVDASGSLSTAGTTGSIEWMKNRGTCSNLDIDETVTETTSFEVKQVGDKLVVHAWVPNLYREQNPGDREPIMIFAEGTNLAGSKGVYNGSMMPANTKQTIEFTGDPSQNMQVLSRAAFDAILKEEGVPVFPYSE